MERVESIINTCEESWKNKFKIKLTKKGKPKIIKKNCQCFNRKSIVIFKNNQLKSPPRNDLKIH